MLHLLSPLSKTLVPLDMLVVRNSKFTLLRVIRLANSRGVRNKKAARLMNIVLLYGMLMDGFRIEIRIINSLN